MYIIVNQILSVKLNWQVSVEALTYFYTFPSIPLNDFVPANKGKRKEKNLKGKYQSSQLNFCAAGFKVGKQTFKENAPFGLCFPTTILIMAKRLGF